MPDSPVHVSSLLWATLLLSCIWAGVGLLLYLTVVFPLLHVVLLIVFGSAFLLMNVGVIWGLAHKIDARHHPPEGS